MEDVAEETTPVAVDILLIVRVCALEVPPPGVGLTTVMDEVPTVAMSEARIITVSDEDDTKVVTRGLPFTLTVDDATKFEPVIVMVKFVPPTVVEAGEIPAVTGMGFVIVKICAAEVPPPGAGFTTVIEAVPAAAMSAAGIMAVMDELEMKVVASGMPFQYTTEELTKFAPEIVRVKLLLPAAVEVGASAVVAETGLLMFAVVVGWVRE
jgi:hypothetical protein